MEGGRRTSARMNAPRDTITFVQSKICFILFIVIKTKTPTKNTCYERQFRILCCFHVLSAQFRIGNLRTCFSDVILNPHYVSRQPNEELSSIQQIFVPWQNQTKFNAWFFVLLGIGIGTFTASISNFITIYTQHLNFQTHIMIVQATRKKPMEIGRPWA